MKTSRTRKYLVLSFFFMQLLFFISTSASEITVSKATMIMRNQPSLNGTIAGSIKDNENYKIISIAGDWSKIEKDTGETGYVLNAYLPKKKDSAHYNMAINIIDVGTGLSIFGVDNHGTSFLFDAGSNDDSTNRTLNFIVKYYPHIKGIDYLFISHPHNDHISYIKKLFSEFYIDKVLLTGQDYDSCVYSRTLEAIQESGSVVYLLEKNLGIITSKTCNGANGTFDFKSSLPLSESKHIKLSKHSNIDIVFADDYDRNNANNNSLVIKINSGETSVLLTGDIEGGSRGSFASNASTKYAEGKLLQCCSKQLESDILIVAHHGSLTSSRQDFIKAVKARSFIISSGPKKYHGTGLPDKEVVEMLNKQGTVFRTDTEDDKCKANHFNTKEKADGLPGGCHNYQINIIDNNYQIIKL